MAKGTMIVSCETFYNSSTIKDEVFRERMRDWMVRNMPCMPMGLLSDDPDHWEVERLGRFSVKDEQEFVFYVCSGCDERFAADEGGVPKCSTCADLCEADEEPPAMTRTTVEGFAVWDEEYGCFVSPENTVTREDESVPTAKGDIAVFILQRDAEEECGEQCTRAHDEEDAEDGAPWMHNWFFHPERYVGSRTLQRAGFTVAYYSGGSGGSVRLAGVNGVGYSHELEHHAKLYVLHHFENGLTMQTSLGSVFVFPRDADTKEIEEAVRHAGL